jgi:hypothetical protein
MLEKGQLRVDTFLMTMQKLPPSLATSAIEPPLLIESQEALRGFMLDDDPPAGPSEEDKSAEAV